MCTQTIQQEKRIPIRCATVAGHCVVEIGVTRFRVWRFYSCFFLLCAFSAEANKFHSLRKISSFTGTRDSPLVFSSLFFFAVVIVSREIRFRASSYDFLLLYPRFPSQTNIVRLFFLFVFGFCRLKKAEV